jgi:hypothetical protein
VATVAEAVANVVEAAVIVVAEAAVIVVAEVAVTMVAEAAVIVVAEEEDKAVSHHAATSEVVTRALTEGRCPSTLVHLVASGGVDHPTSKLAYTCKSNPHCSKSVLRGNILTSTQQGIAARRPGPQDHEA